ncbi:DUF515 domain-containing protein [Cnuibacter physcomitrellae]|uniref:DUF515 domain-containing protein n=1 Tax=Cnuibacter physcomitrellae TaxID=1619308 RepID=UPI002175D31F|nr:DUF515 domain-containing protein [Cnuibacter physcomitrellae]MCS5498136.1 DUF515 domain-containing protein [Cnuibacter physcomitrellae]
MAESLESAQQRVLSLNGPDVPFEFSPTATGVVGRWKYADVKWAAFTGAGLIDASYVLTVTLDPTEGTWEFDEQDSQSGVKVSGGAGGFSISGGTSTFRGHQTRTTRTWGAGSAASTTDRQGEHLGNTYGYTFSTSEIKDAAIAALEVAGYSKKKGFFGRLFS